jgi:mRNA deadenylase 3'-5' endonuclease subunit Ccr4
MSQDKLKAAMKTNNIMMLGQRIISMAEQSEYTTLYDDFKKRLKDENRKTDEKEIGEKRPILESPLPREFKKEEVTKQVKKQRINRGEEGY